MLVDALTTNPGPAIDADVCIVGSAAAGITLARSLDSGDRTVCVLEGGGLRRTRDSQSLYEGVCQGTVLDHRPRYISRSRLRYFGGTTGHWTGFCRPLDELDFATRSWVPHSGWPITKADLAPYYLRAADVVEIAPFDDTLDEGLGGPEAVIIQSENLVTKRFRFSPPTRFGRVYRRELARSRRVSVWLNANVTAIDVNEAGSRIAQLQVTTPNGRRFVVRAKAFVLAAGGIENARLLLVSDAVQKSGLGNQRDLVGRFFMDHPHVGGGSVVLTDRSSALASYQRTRADRTMAVLCPSARAQKSHGLLNASISLRSEPIRRQSEAGGMPLAIGPAVYRVDCLGEAGETAEVIQAPYARALVRSEPAPNPDSRVTIDADVDQLGVRRAHLDWRLSELDRQSIWQTMDLVSREFAVTRRGRVLTDVREDMPWQGVSGGSHHMGTTRMSDSPSTGVVDKTGRLHGVSNLYVAGSSVFPTVGFANPTLTIIALSLRLADHLSNALQRG